MDSPIENPIQMESQLESPMQLESDNEVESSGKTNRPVVKPKLIAVVFDPRYKLQVIEWAYKKIYENNAVFELDLFKGKLFALYDEYASSTPTSTTPHGIGQRSHVVNVEQSSDTYMEDFDEYDSGSFDNSGKCELQMYLEEQKLPRTCDIDVLEHWKTLQRRYPIAARMARDILAIPISTVASESAFSIGGRVLDAYRSSLNPSTAEALICLKDWVFQKDSTPSDIDQLCAEVVGLKVEDGLAVDDEDSNSRSQL